MPVAILRINICRLFATLITLAVLSAFVLAAHAQEDAVAEAEAARLKGQVGELYQQSKYAEAIPLAKRVLEIDIKVLGEDHPSVATDQKTLALLYQAMGDYARAEPLYKKALEIWEKALGREHPQVLVGINHLASLYMKKGDYAHAEALFKRVLEIFKKTLDEDHTLVAHGLNRLAFLYYDMSDYTRAEPLFKRVLAIREKKLGPNHPDVANSLNCLAVLYQAMGDYARAEPLAKRALAIREKKLGPNHPDVANSLNNLAELYRAMGDYARAESLHRRTLDILEKAQGEDHSKLAISLINLTLLKWARGKVEDVLPLLFRTAKVTEKRLSHNLSLGSEKQNLAFLDTVKWHVDISISFHLDSMPQSEAAARLALETLLRRKGRGLDTMAETLSAIRRNLGPEEQALLDDLSAVRSGLSKLVFGGLGNLSVDEIAKLEKRQEELERALSARSARFRTENKPVTLEAVAGVLDKDEVLVEYVRYEPFNPRAKGNEKNYGDPRYAAGVLLPDGSVKWIDLGPAEKIDEAVEGFRGSLIHRKRDVEKRSRELDELVIKPVRELLDGQAHLYVSPDGQLNLVPFWALMDEKDRYLIDTFDITYLTSGRDLLRQAERGEPKIGPVAFGDPDYAGSGGSSSGDVRGRRSHSLGELKFSSLPDTHDEILAAEEAFGELTKYLGADATEEKIKELGSPSVLIAATHGFFMPDQEIELAGGTGARGGGFSGGLSSAPRVKGRVENPMLRSGLAFAGANVKRSKEDDGILTALEAAGLDLWGTRLVVLSACETAVGESKTGQGVYGLRRALVLAGAESQVLSLWSVHSEATTALMSEYYRRIKAGEGRSAALRRASQGMRQVEGWEHPYYWAAFIPGGDPRTLDGKPDPGPSSPIAPVARGPRGCSCQTTGGEQPSPAWILTLLAALLLLAVRGGKRNNVGLASQGETTMTTLHRSIIAIMLIALLPTGCATVEKCQVRQPEPPGPGEGMEMVAGRDAVCLAAPGGKVTVSGKVTEGTKVKATRSAEGRMETWIDGNQWCGWVEASALVPEESAGTRGVGLIVAPLLVAAGKYIVTKIKEWAVEKGEEAVEKAVCGAVEVLKTEGDRVLVKTKDGLKGWADKNDMTALADVMPVTDDGIATDLMEGGSMPEKPSGLVVEARVTRPNGELVLPGETLHLGDEYDIDVRCSDDCYVRITCETPGTDALCQYHPSHFSSFAKSRRLPGGKWVHGDLLPQDEHFKVGEPLAEKDVIRIEANTYRPYQYISGEDKGVGCLGIAAVKDGAATGCSRGGGFSGEKECSDARGVRGGDFSDNTNLQPQAEAVAMLEIRTSR